MTHSIKTFLLIIIFLNYKVPAQEELYIPQNILKAYRNETRNMNGMPGEKYWQNRSDYFIKASVDPSTRILKGSEKITYYNNSPDSLDRIVFDLYQNMYRYGAARDIELMQEALSGGVQIEKFKFGSKEIDLEGSRIQITGTKLVFFPEKFLAPSSNCEFEISWNFTIPAGSTIRMGAYDSTSFFTGYWFPRISVYDDIDGWDLIQYTALQEFYNDYSDFEVQITVPNNYAVWGTGIFQNPEEVFNDKYLSRFKTALKSDSVVRIVSPGDLKSGKIFRQEKADNTWKFNAVNVTDFAFGMSDHYLWDALSFADESKNTGRIYVASVYREESADFYSTAEAAGKTLEYFAEIFPGVPLPYSSYTIFNGKGSGGGGMEFPMIVNNGSSPNISAMKGLLAHELAHQYFPFMTGINEKKYAWMDEGLAVFIPFDFLEETAGYDRRISTAANYQEIAGSDIDLPMMTPSYFLEGAAYRRITYHKSGIAFDILKDALGEELFQKCLKEFIKRWQGKHPGAYDLFYTFNDVAGENLNWYWKPWFFEQGYPDLFLGEIENTGGTVKITVKKRGSMPVPVDLLVLDHENTGINIYRDPTVWKDGRDEIVIEEKFTGKIKSVLLGSEVIPDLNYGDNFFSAP